MYQGSQADLCASSQLSISTHFSGPQKKPNKWLRVFFAAEYIQKVSFFEMGRFKERCIESAECLLSALLQGINVTLADILHITMQLTAQSC